MVHEKVKNHLSPINAKKSFYKGVPIVEFDYQEGKKNHVEINKCCAVRTQKGLCIIGKLFKIKDAYMVIRTSEIGKVKITYSMITGMFPCSLPDDYFIKEKEVIKTCG